jgi:hypothetical protein
MGKKDSLQRQSSSNVISMLWHHIHLRIFFHQRVLNSWNGLLQEVVDAETINSLKNRLDKFKRKWFKWRLACLAQRLQADNGFLNQNSS